MNELENIYLERKQMYLKLFAEGKSWEEARQIVDKQDFGERIDAVVFPKGKKKEYEPETGDVLLIYAIVGDNNNSKCCKYTCKKADSTINGKAVYHRIFIKRVGFAVYLGQDLWDYYIEVNEDVKDVNEAVNLLNNTALVYARYKEK